MTVSNYDITRENAKQLFIKYNQKNMIRKFGLDYDSDYLYMRFLNRDYRINRENGTVEWFGKKDAVPKEADFNVTLTLFDILCYSKADCRASGTYSSVINLKGTGHTSDPAKDIYEPYKRKFDHRLTDLAQACEMLGGEKYVVGDVSYIIPVFADLSMLIQFWESDDEFDAQMKMKWDTNVLDYMHFETVHYAMGHILQRLEEIIYK